LGLVLLICNEKEGLISKLKYNCNNSIIILKLIDVILSMLVKKLVFFNQNIYLTYINYDKRPKHIYLTNY